jgi:hypothetical protein
MEVFAGNHYLAYVITEATKQLLCEAFPPAYEVVKCHHVTIAYPVKEEDVDFLQKLVDSNPQFVTDCYINADGIDLSTVLIDGVYVRHDGKYYYITHSRTEERSSDDSNKVLLGEVDILSHAADIPIILNGEFKLIPIE